MNDIYNALPGLYDLMPKPTSEQWGMSSIENEFGMSLPETHSVAPAAPATVSKTRQSNSDMDNFLFSISQNNLYSPINTSSGTSNGMLNWMDSYTNWMMGMKGKGEKDLAQGYALKSVAAAGDLFNKLLTYGYTLTNANLKASNTKQSVENQMLALDNQVQYYKNQIADKFNQTMARNAVTMAAKNLRVTAGNLLEQTKDAAYDATKDIRMLESNAELKKIALRSEAAQADVTKKLTKNVATAELIGSLAKVGLVVSSGIAEGVDFGNLFSSGTDSLNETVLGGKE